jgi:hypothetical protein
MDDAGPDDTVPPRHKGARTTPSKCQNREPHLAACLVSRSVQLRHLLFYPRKTRKRVLLPRVEDQAHTRDDRGLGRGSGREIQAAVLLHAVIDILPQGRRTR